jgi:hypothetical protein
MNYLIFNGYQVAQSEQPIVYNPERRSWLLIDKNTEYSDFDGTAYSVSANPASPPPRPVPQVVPIRQACRALEAAGLLDDVEAIVATLPRIYQIDWQRATEVQRNNPLVEIVRQQKAMTSEQIDALFLIAVTL